MSYPKFEVAGVPESEVWQLFNVSNYQYYKQKVASLIAGVCPFCTIDPAVNDVLFENHSWRLWKNEMAPRSGQRLQLIIPSKRHIQCVDELTYDELGDLAEALAFARYNLGVADGVVVIRSGDPALNAKSVPHLHVNYQVPNGVDRVEVTIAKSQDDLKAKLPVLLVFEKMRQLELADEKDPFSKLSPEEQKLVEKKLAPPPTKS